MAFLTTHLLISELWKIITNGKDLVKNYPYPQINGFVKEAGEFAPWIRPKSSILVFYNGKNFRREEFEKLMSVTLCHYAVSTLLEKVALTASRNFLQFFCCEINHISTKRKSVIVITESSELSTLNFKNDMKDFFLKNIY